MPVEYDLDSFNRKWKGTVAKINKVDGFSYVVEGTPDGQVIYAPLSALDVRKVVDADMQYYHFASGWYRSLDDVDKWYCLYRLLKKTFKVGISRDTHNCFSYTTEKDVVTLVGGINEPFIRINYDTAENERLVVGCLSRRLFVSSTKLYYLTTPIGFVSNRKVTLVNKFFHQEVSDALRGHPWLTLN
jgi:hypothetical protein